MASFQRHSTPSAQDLQQFPIPRQPVPPLSKSAVQEHLIDEFEGSPTPDTEHQPHMNHHHRELWISRWSQRRTLFGFVALFVAFDASLIAVWSSNEAQSGFRTTLSSNHYAWTYGPTAILVIVLGLWHQVDYQCKINQPWQEMRNGPTSPHCSLLLDYVSPLPTTSFLRAVKYQHLPVAASTAAMMILKLIVVFSTGLLVLKPTKTSEPVPTTITTRFDGSSFWNPINRHLTYTPSEFGEYVNISPAPVYTYLGLLNGEISDPKGTMDGKAFQSYKTDPDPNLDSISLQVSTFIPNITCEIALPIAWYTSIPPTLDVYGAAVQLDTATCSLGHKSQQPLFVSGPPSRQCSLEDCPAFQILYDMWQVNCSDGGERTTQTIVDNTSGTNTPGDIRYALAVTNVSYFHWESQALNSGPNKTIHDVSSVVCKVDYFMDQAMVTHNMNEDTYHIDYSTSATHLANLTGLMLGELVLASFNNASDLLWDTLDNGALYYSLFDVLLQTLPQKKTMARFLSAEVLQQSATHTLGGVATQFMQQFYLVADDADAVGTGTFTEDRLRIEIVSLWAMVAGFVLLIVNCIIIISATSNCSVPQNPAYIATGLTILAASPGLQSILSGVGSYRSSQLKERLSGYNFRTRVDERFGIEVVPNKLPEKSVPKAQTKDGCWIPHAARARNITLTLASPPVIIVALEVLYRISKAKMGLVDVSQTENLALYLSRYLPAAVMLSIAANFNRLDFAVTSFAPFSSLRSGAVHARRALYCDLLGETPPIALFQALRNSHFGTAFSNISRIIGGALTIVASGLWTIDHAVIANVPTTASLTSDWNLAWLGTPQNDSGAADTLSQIQHGIKVFPSRIWNDLVFPDIAVVGWNDDGPDEYGSAIQNYTFEVPAVRPRLDCQVIDDEYIEIQCLPSSSGDDDGYWHLDILVRPPLGPGCQLGTKFTLSDNETTFNSDTYLLNRPDEKLWLGLFTDILPKDNKLGRWNDEQLSNPPGCPSAAILVADTKGNATTHDDITAMVCSQKLQQVTVEARFSGTDGSNLVIDYSIMPEPNEHTARYLTNGTAGVEAFPYSVSMVLSTFGDISDQRATWGQDPFFNNIIYGPERVPQKDLSRRKNQDQLLEAVQNLYTKWMDLVLDLHFRQQVPADGERTRIPGTVLTRTARLQINPTSKLILQIMLAAMTVLGAAAFWLSDLRGTLPRSPCSIASTMGFLAESDLCNPMKPMLHAGAEWLGRREMEKILDGWLFSLGWWQSRRPMQEQEAKENNDDSGTVEQPLVPVGKGEKSVARFGIDIGVPDRLGFRETKQWTLRRRLRRASS